MTVTLSDIENAISNAAEPSREPGGAIPAWARAQGIDPADLDALILRHDLSDVALAKILSGFGCPASRGVVRRRRRFLTDGTREA